MLKPMCTKLVFARVRSGLYSSLPTAYPSEQRGPPAHTLKINEFGQSFEQIFQRKVELQIL